MWDYIFRIYNAHVLGGCWGRSDFMSSYTYIRTCLNIYFHDLNISCTAMAWLEKLFILYIYVVEGLMEDWFCAKCVLSLNKDFIIIIIIIIIIT